MKKMNKLKEYFKTWSMLILAVFVIANCDDRSGLTSSPVIAPLTVSFTNPSNSAVNVPFNQSIVVTFSEEMDSLFITTATFTLMQETSFVSGTVSLSGATATFKPLNNLTPNTTYIATITTMAKSISGGKLAKNYVWSFTTGATALITAPTVSSTNPINAATAVPINQKIAATFSVAMDATNITTSTFTVLQGSTPVAGFVSYSGTTALFTPSSSLDPNTKYTATITTGAKDIAGNKLANNYVWSFTTGATAVTTPPVVSITNPLNNATAVPINQKITASFSVVMDATTITTSTFTVLQGTTPVVGFVSYSGTTALFTPANNLDPNKIYTATITTGAQDLAGNKLANKYVWSFTTGAIAPTTSPTVSSTNPLNAATAVPINQKIAATFSVAMDATTITTATFTLMQGTTFVSGSVFYVGTTATYSPSSNLSPSTTYTATITTGAKDLSGNALKSNYVWTFTTGATAVTTPPAVIITSPLNNATAVPINQKIAATFSVVMDATTITSSTFTVLQGTTPVVGFVSYSGTTALFTPANNLDPNKIYTATITTGAQDLAGNKLANKYIWNFTTGSVAPITPPTVSSTNPLNAATAVPINQKIAATFSVAMDATTITTATFTLMQGTTFVSGTVFYVGTTATYSPSSNLSPSTTYTATITTGAKDLSGNALKSNYVWTFTTGATAVTTPPVVISTNPLNNATAVPINQKIGATFSVVMDATSITASTFTVLQGTTPVVGFVSYSGTTALFTPANNLESNKLYTATITTGAQDLAGNKLVNKYTWSFTTVAIVPITPPTVISTNPLDKATDVPINQKVGATFSMDMDATTITSSTFTLVQGTTPVSGFVSFSGRTALFTPANNLAQNKIYTATITTGVKNLAGNKLVSNYVWSFTTSAAVIKYTVVLSSNPALGGTTSGSGTFDEESNVTVTAAPNIGYAFTNWTESGNILSTNTNYNFVLQENKVLVANFKLSGQMPLDLGTAARFAILSNSAITNISSSDIKGDVGISPGLRASITGFSGFARDPGLTYSTSPEVTQGYIYAADDAIPTPAMLIAAKSDAESAYLDAIASVRGTPTPISGNINGLTLAPGLYESGSTIEISPGGKLYLDAGGNANAVFIFRSATSITTESTSEVVLAGSAKAANIYWVAGSAVTLGTNSIMKGTIIASTSISVLTSASVTGRLLIQSAAAGQVSLDQSTIVLP